ncbi:MAG: DNA mismatch repair protein [Clostridium sp.]|uniref:MutS family DNA mismatch repair protein n=1 Tax=Clostridium sp. TaxID=1506 RepID=UPI0025C56210|nr:MutS family DNA mismatch repair protein [Clostridium sp.]MCH3963869.1 DNA mismatch repair protein [Clostridium sp.]MCI1716988.1 DNA mismatch repair protein [Clostridium sp.]MCI1801293.1 DNA mismatch repair protein [Clostridium sp.]MCI1815139.1 DNA mismatch repair protein [Clostridium sp.]MCI1872077.1 DNA mismatch repair protein [Clostridium sp.]
MRNIEDIYERRKSHYKWLSERQNSFIKFISIVRLFIFIVGLAAVILLYKYSYIFLSISMVLVFTILFIVSVKLHEKIARNFKFTMKLYDINRISCHRLQGKWIYFDDDGHEFKDENHNYAYDLDVFGKGSIFQWINTGETYYGRKRLKEVLSCRQHETEDILEKQVAIQELADKLNFRQRLQAQAYFTRCEEGTYNISDLVDLLKCSGKGIYKNPFIIIAFKIIPFVNMLILFMFFALHMVNSYIVYMAIIFSVILLCIDSKNRSKSMDILFKLKENVKSYKKIIDMIYTGKFSSEYLNRFKKVFDCGDAGNSPKKEFKPIRELVRIANNISERRNMAYIFLNIFFLWDYQCMFALEKWKINSGHVQEWIDIVGEFEMLCSLALINSDHPNWVIPEIISDQLEIKAESMAHPLIRGNAVSNDLNMDRSSKILLITGSNMSGKSTFLRTAGVNLILAYTGAAVCADYFRCSIMNIYTCMRISDNLDKNVSSFYGEILRIKSIVEAAKRGENIFFLLDEIFKGTNSIDRHAGAKILINELNSLSTCGMVSTHDLELCDLENKNNSSIKNYYFREYYKNNKIYFDYKLHRGISKTRNALYLMKMAGIDISDNIKSD